MSINSGEHEEMGTPAKVRINFKSGEVELEGSESFVQGQLENIDTIAEYVALLASSNFSGSTELEEEEEIAALVEEEEDKLSSAGEQGLEMPGTFGEWFHGFRDDINDLDKALIAAYFVQKQSSDNDLKTSEVNKSLKDHGIKLTNPSTSLRRLETKKLLFQTRKVGSLKFKRASADGVNHLKSLRR
ncbi:MAG: hypothetical protein ACFB12_08045 [Leptolyngbyaceae cyanobacterium]